MAGAASTLTTTLDAPARGVDSGTAARIATPPPGPLVAARSPALLPDRGPETVRSKPVEKEVADTAVAPIGQLTWDAFVRSNVYEPAAKAISEQGEAFVRSGRMTTRDAAEWVNAQRNALVVATRDSRNSPLGRAIAEYLKPRDSLPDLQQVMARHAARTPLATTEELFEAVIKSGARTRASVNRLSIVVRRAGPVLIAVDIALSAYLVWEAPPEQRGRVAMREGGAMALGFGGGWAGAQLGCEGGAAVGVWFEGVGAIPGCLIGGAAGALGFGWAGSKAGGALGEAGWDAARTVVEWQ